MGQARRIFYNTHNILCHLRLEIRPVGVRTLPGRVPSAALRPVGLALAGASEWTLQLRCLNLLEQVAQFVCLCSDSFCRCLSISCCNLNLRDQDSIDYVTWNSALLSSHVDAQHVIPEKETTTACTRTKLLKSQTELFWTSWSVKAIHNPLPQLCSRLVSHVVSLDEVLVFAGYSNEMFVLWTTRRVPGRSTNIGLGFRLQRPGSEEVSQMFRVEDTRLCESSKNFWCVWSKSN